MKPSVEEMTKEHEKMYPAKNTDHMAGKKPSSGMHDQMKNMVDKRRDRMK